MYVKVGYGQVFYGDSRLSGDEVETVDLMQYLPDDWRRSDLMTELQKAIGHEIEALLVFKKDLQRQLHIETATWGLGRWENVFGLDTDIKKSYEFRRERVKARVRGAGTTTKQMIINVASAFSGGEAMVVEYPREKRFVVKFVGVKGIPPNMIGLRDTIDEIKPAHLAFAFEYTYNYWNNIKAKSWDNVGVYTWDQLKVI